MLKELKLNEEDKLCLEGKVVSAVPLGEVLELRLPSELFFAGDHRYLHFCIEQNAPKKADAYLLLAKGNSAFPEKMAYRFFWVRYYSLQKF